jgi:hypothetical protein
LRLVAELSCGAPATLSAGNAAVGVLGDSSLSTGNLGLDVEEGLNMRVLGGTTAGLGDVRISTGAVSAVSDDDVRYTAHGASDLKRFNTNVLQH